MDKTIDKILNKIKQQYPLEYGEQLIDPKEFYELVEDFKNEDKQNMLTNLKNNKDIEIIQKHFLQDIVRIKHGVLFVIDKHIVSEESYHHQTSKKYVKQILNGRYDKFYEVIQDYTYFNWNDNIIHVKKGSYRKTGKGIVVVKPENYTYTFKTTADQFYGCLATMDSYLTIAKAIMMSYTLGFVK